MVEKLRHAIARGGHHLSKIENEIDVGADRGFPNAKADVHCPVLPKFAGK